MTFEIIIITGSVDPIYKQVMDQIKLGIAQGSLEIGAQLPTVRALSKSLLVNVNTIAKAYSELVKEGVIVSTPGRGAFVAERRQIYTEEERYLRLNQAIDTLINDTVTLNFSKNEIQEAFSKRWDTFQFPTKKKK